MLLVVDARAGNTPIDRHFAGFLQKLEIPVLLVANKCEGKIVATGLYEGFELGFGEPIGISAEHGVGLADLYEVIQPLVSLKESGAEETNNFFDKDNSPLHMAIVGRPNVGKSTLLNSLLEEDRVITGPAPGVTRDTNSVD